MSVIPIVIKTERFGLSAETWKLIGLLTLLIGACAIPFFTSGYRLYQLSMILVTANAVLSLVILTGHNGQISLGHGAFYTFGAYAAAILMNSYALPYWVTIPAAGALCFAIGFVFGLPMSRLREMDLALATIALATVAPIFVKYKLVAIWTGGVHGIVVTKPQAPFGLGLSVDQRLYYFTFFVTAILVVLARNLLRGRIGRAIHAIRDQPIAAKSMGINITFYKTTIFAISALYAGIAGALSAVVVGYVSLNGAAGRSLGLLIGAVIGGIVSISGAFYGAAVLLLLPNLVDGISKALPGAIFGASLILLMLVMPGGLASFLRLTWAWMQRKLFE